MTLPIDDDGTACYNPFDRLARDSRAASLYGMPDVTPDNPTLDEALRDFDDGLENPELSAVWDWRLPNDAPAFSIDEYREFLESSATEYGGLIRTAIEQMGKRGASR